MSAHQTLLRECAAVVLAHNSSEARPVLALGQKAGFGIAEYYSGQDDIVPETVKVLFFLVHFALSDEIKVAMLRSIRLYPGDRVRLAPVILVSEDCSASDYLAYIEMGFDDIICLPEKSEIITDRLVTQLNRDHLYIETNTYFGPDRRRMELSDMGRVDRISDTHRHVRYIVHRSVEKGPVIVRRKDFWRKGRTTPRIPGAPWS